MLTVALWNANHNTDQQEKFPKLKDRIKEDNPVTCSDSAHSLTPPIELCALRTPICKCMKAYLVA
jgi:hypothetical protein